MQLRPTAGRPRRCDVAGRLGIIRLGRPSLYLRLRSKFTRADMTMHKRGFGCAACICVVIFSGSAEADTTVTLSTSDPSVVAAFGKAGQGWWSLDTPNILGNTNYITGTSFNVSPGINYEYRSFFTFDLDNPVLRGQTVLSAEIRLQAFLGTGFNDGNQISFFNVTTDPFVLNHTVGIAPQSIWDDLGSGVIYGSGPVGSGSEILPTDIFGFYLNSSAIADLNNAIGNGFFSIGASKDLREVFSGSSANGNQQLVLDVAPAASVPIPDVGTGLPGLFFASVILLAYWRRLSQNRLATPRGPEWQPDDG
jgi:hypothetical protein